MTFHRYSPLVHLILIGLAKSKSLLLLFWPLFRRFHLFRIDVGRLVVIPNQVFASCCELQRLISVNHSTLPFWRKESLQHSHPIWRILFSARITLYPLSSHIVHNYRISMVRTQFVLFTENFVFRCNDIPKFCGSWYPVLSTFRISSAWSSLDLCAFAWMETGVLLKMIEKIVFPSRIVRGSRFGEGSLESLALGLPKSAVGLPMLHWRFGDFCRQWLQVRLSAHHFPTCNEYVSHPRSMWVIVFLSVRRKTHVLRIIFQARVQLVNLPIIHL